MTNTPTTFFGWIIFLIQQYHGYYLWMLFRISGWNHPGNGHPGAG